MTAGCANCSGHADAFVAVPGARWTHWDGRAVGINVTNALTSLRDAGAWGVNVWNAVQGRLYLAQQPREPGPTIYLYEYQDATPPLAVHNSPDLWLQVLGAAVLYNATKERINPAIEDKRIAWAEVYLRASGFASVEQARESVAHELGHCLGLADVLPNAPDPDPGGAPRIMRYTNLWGPGNMWPTDDDVRSVLSVYDLADPFPAPAEYFPPDGPRVVLRHWSRAARAWHTFDSRAPEYANTLLGLDRGMELLTEAEEPVEVRVGQSAVRVAAGQDIVEWPSP
ncbi:MAG: hypothetical protein Q7T33_02515 [Dehalococcoidia bacterium]|nr:hypothetical protein [Dehalococcoidia bacterium]